MYMVCSQKKVIDIGATQPEIGLPNDDLGISTARTVTGPKGNLHAVSTDALHAQPTSVPPGFPCLPSTHLIGVVARRYKHLAQDIVPAGKPARSACLCLPRCCLSWTGDGNGRPKICVSLLSRREVDDDERSVRCTTNLAKPFK